MLARARQGSPLRTEDEDDVRAPELACAHAVERADELHAEILPEALPFAREARLVHDEAP